ncbi:olfactory receptor 1019-like [Spea bombifrons]|uniref:olfactory receptor 1019-like n=1 Tax=Spea bombifrons TaxID=233779 RepID=UPI00234B6B4F|nr:olfactory receptor 1019-like [Spea bombifrons]
MELPKVFNSSWVNEFILMEFSSRYDIQIGLFMVFFLIYLITFLGNASIVFLVYHNVQLHTPMYFFISTLSLLDLCYSTDIAPKMIIDVLSEKKTISYIGCAVQLFFFCAFGSTECCLLAVMAYDRYVAICRPLNYSLVMQTKTCLTLVSGACTAGFLHSVIETCCTFSLSFCTSNILNHFACDFPPLLGISCTDTTINELILFICTSSIIVPSFLVIIVSYVSIFFAILRKQFADGMKKAFSTCISHITSVTLFFATGLYVYLSPKSKYSTRNGIVATFVYAVMIPMSNPIIYSFRNKDIKTALQTTFQSRFPYKK